MILITSFIIYFVIALTVNLLSANLACSEEKESYLKSKNSERSYIITTNNENTAQVKANTPEAVINGETISEKPFVTGQY